MSRKKINFKLIKMNWLLEDRHSERFSLIYNSFESNYRALEAFLLHLNL